MPTFMFSSSDSVAAGRFRIAYEELRDYARDYLALAHALDDSVTVTNPFDAVLKPGSLRVDPNSDLAEFSMEFEAALGQLNAAKQLGLTSGNFDMGMSEAVSAGKLAAAIGESLTTVANLVEENERKVKGLQNYATGNGAVRSPGFDTVSHAAAFYAAESQRRQDEEEAERKKQEKKQQQEDAIAELEKVDPELAEELRQQLQKAEFEAWLEELKKKDPELAAKIEAMMQAKTDAENAAKLQAESDEFMEDLWAIAPETAQELQDKKDKEALDQWLQEVKEKHPELYDKIVAELKRQEEAQKAAAEAAAAMEAELAGLGDGLGDSDLDGLGLDASSLDEDGSAFGDSSDWGSSNYGGSSDWGSAASDWGGSSEWASDLLEDTIDGEELRGSSEALDGIAGAVVGGATGFGADALASTADRTLEEVDTSLMATYGPKLAAFAQAYGLQAAATLGGAAVLYATREQTTEAVAYLAEFVSTKCKPFATDVMDQVKGAAKQTRVSISNTKSKVVGVAHGEEVGDLIG